MMKLKKEYLDYMQFYYKKLNAILKSESEVEVQIKNKLKKS